MGAVVAQTVKGPDGPSDDWPFIAVGSLGAGPLNQYVPITQLLHAVPLQSLFEIGGLQQEGHPI